MSKNDSITIFDEAPDLEMICDTIANGGTLSQYCEQNALVFSKIKRWIDNSPTRTRAYESAVAMRDDNVAQRLSSLLFGIVSFDPSQIYDKHGHVLPVSQWPQSARAALSSMQIDPETGNILKVQFLDRLKAIQTAGKAVKMFEKKKDDGNASLEELILKAGGKNED